MLAISPADAEAAPPAAPDNIALPTSPLVRKAIPPLISDPVIAPIPADPTTEPRLTAAAGRPTVNAVGATAAVVATVTLLRL